MLVIWLLAILKVWRLMLGWLLKRTLGGLRVIVLRPVCTLWLRLRLRRLLRVHIIKAVVLLRSVIHLWCILAKRLVIIFLVPYFKTIFRFVLTKDLVLHTGTSLFRNLMRRKCWSRLTFYFVKRRLRRSIRWRFRVLLCLLESLRTFVNLDSSFPNFFFKLLRLKIKLRCHSFF